MMRATSAALAVGIASCTSALPPETAVPSDACRAHGVAEDVSVMNGLGPLYGTLTLPAGCGAFAAVLIIAGSGATDRNGNNGPGLQTDTYRLLAEGLQARGVAALRYDKAGVGPSRVAAPSTEDAGRRRGPPAEPPSR